MSKREEEFQWALEKIRSELDWISAAVDRGVMTIEAAGIKLRSKSIELGVVACMPFRDDTASKR
jgi:hypothetical protein